MSHFDFNSFKYKTSRSRIVVIEVVALRISLTIKTLLYDIDELIEMAINLIR